MCHKKSTLQFEIIITSDTLPLVAHNSSHFSVNDGCSFFCASAGLGFVSDCVARAAGTTTSKTATNHHSYSGRLRGIFVNQCEYIYYLVASTDATPSLTIMAMMVVPHTSHFRCRCGIINCVHFSMVYSGFVSNFFLQEMVVAGWAHFEYDNDTVVLCLFKYKYRLLLWL